MCNFFWCRAAATCGRPGKSCQSSSTRKFRALRCPQNSMVANKLSASTATTVTIFFQVWHVALCVCMYDKKISAIWYVIIWRNLTRFDGTKWLLTKLYPIFGMTVFCATKIGDFRRRPLLAHNPHQIPPCNIFSLSSLFMKKETTEISYWWWTQ